MPESADNAVQIGIYDALANHAALTALLANNEHGGPAIYDVVPQVKDTGRDSDFPYLVIGDDILNEWSTDTAEGENVAATIHVWSRAGSMREAKKIIGEIKAALSRAELTIPDHEFIGCEFETSTCVIDPDMETVHGTAQFRLYIDEPGYGE